MKKNRIIALIVALLSLVTLLAGCTGSSEPLDEPAIENATHTDYIEYENEETIIALNGATRLPESYGKVYKQSGYLFIFENKEKDFLNNVTETYTFYNAKNDTVVKTVTHSYEDGDYTGKDDFGNDNYAPSTLEVGIVNKSSGDYNISYFTAKHTVSERIDDEVIKDNSLTLSYELTVDYFLCFDAEGTEFFNTNLYYSDSGCSFNGSRAVVTYGDVKTLFDANENKVIKSWNVGNGDHFALYDAENEKYGYFFNAKYGALDDFLGNSSLGKGAVEVYDKETEQLVIRYPLNQEALFNGAALLNNGDVIIQSIITVDSPDYDFLFTGIKASLQTLVLNVETGTVKSYPDFKYFITKLYTASDLEYPVGAIADMGFTDNATNYVIAQSIEKQAEFQNSAIVKMFMNSDLSIQYVVTKLHPEQNENVPVKKLSTGDLLVTLSGASYPYAIVKADGTFRTYVPQNADIVGKYIVTEKGVYDFDMKLYYEFKYYFLGEDYRYLQHIGNYLIFERRYTSDNATVKDWTILHVEDCKNRMNTDEGIYDGIYDGYYGLDVSYQSEYISNVRVIYSDDSCIAVYDGNNNRYLFLNSKAERLITSTNTMKIVKAGDKYIVSSGDFIFRVSANENNYEYGGDGK